MSEVLDALLDSTLDDLSDLPSFTPFPAGGHRVTITLEAKEINKHPCVEMKLKLIEVIELSEPLPQDEEGNDIAPVEGDECNTLYFLDNDVGQGKFKEVAIVLGAALNLTGLRDIVDQVTDLECVIVSTVQQDKDDKDKQYMNVKEIQVV